jgi:rare lipoprotein A
MAVRKGSDIGRAGADCAADVPNTAARNSCARTLLILPASMLLIASSGVFAASNPEAASPQRTPPPPRQSSPSGAQSTSRPTQTQTRPASQSVLRPTPSATPVAKANTAPVQAVRTVTVPVLGREGPAAAAAQQASRQIAITASEPELTSAVRPSDVAVFQKIGAPYQVNGIWYVPAHEPDYDETGVASWYGDEFQGKPTANGEIFDMNVVSAAHPTLPIPSMVEVTNLTNGRSIIVRINDRGPFVGSRLIDLSSRGAELLGFRNQGHTNVRVRYVGPANAEPVVTAQNLSQPIHVAADTGTKPLGEAAIAPPPPRPRAVASVATPVAAAVAEQAAVTPQQTLTAQSGQAFVQVGAFSLLANANRLRDQTASLGPVQVVEAANAEGNTIYRVVLGPVANRAEALAKVQEINAGGTTSARVMASLN